MELVSVIITTYNRNDKFERALKSVLNQNYPNIEIIIVNDYPGDDYELVKIINKSSTSLNCEIFDINKTVGIKIFNVIKTNFCIEYSQLFEDIKTKSIEAKHIIYINI